MDAFYAAIEQRDDPSLRGKPVIVGGMGRRGVVSTASYEARKFGVHSAMPTYRARELCPHGVFLRGRMQVYVEVSRALMRILGNYAPEVEPLSLDEAFIDLTGTEALFGPPEKTARRIQEEIRAELDLTASIGLASVKFIAKIASDLEKPAGITVCPPGQERTFLAPLDVRKLWGVGPKAAQRLAEMGLKRVGDIARLSREDLEIAMGKHGVHVWQLAQGIDPRAVSSDRERKSLGAERTFEENIQGEAAVKKKLLPLVDEVAADLRKKGLLAGGVRLKIKYADFTTVTRHRKLLEPAHDATAILEAIVELIARTDVDQPIRLAGLAATELSEEHGARQQSLFDTENKKKRNKLDDALDAVNARFGKGALKRASDVDER